MTQAEDPISNGLVPFDIHSDSESDYNGYSGKNTKKWMQVQKSH